MRFVRSTPPPLLTALSCLETALERQAVVNEQVVDQSPRRLHCCVLQPARRSGAARRSHFLSSANYNLRGELFFFFFFPIQLPSNITLLSKITSEAFSAETRRLDWVFFFFFFLPLAMQKSAHLNFKTRGCAMIKFSDRLGMFQATLWVCH